MVKYINGRNSSTAVEDAKKGHHVIQLLSIDTIGFQVPWLEEISICDQEGGGLFIDLANKENGEVEFVNWKCLFFQCGRSVEVGQG
jgi:hypothetical protein